MGDSLMKRGKKQESQNELVLSFIAVRQALGALGVALPLLLIAGAILFSQGLERSISDFYYTQMSDLFVGIMCAIGVFLFVYKGYNKQQEEWLSDRLVARVAGAAAICVALIPTNPHTGTDPPCSLVQCISGAELAAKIHYASATLFFAMLALFCLVLFCRSDPDKPKTRAKTRRNRVFHICGWILVSAMALLFLYAVLPDTTKASLDRFSYIFWLESLGVWAFGVSWLIKGQMIGFLNDSEEAAPASSR